MKTIYLKKFKDNSGFGMIYTNSLNRESQLYLMIFIINSSFIYEQLKNEKSIFEVGDFGETSVVQGYDDDDYYVAFENKILYRDYAVDVDGISTIDSLRLPKLKFSKENFNYISKLIIKIYENKPMYLIITQDDTGWIEVQAKNELDSDELRMVDEYKQYQEKLRAEEKERIAKRNQKIN